MSKLILVYKKLSRILMSEFGTRGGEPREAWKTAINCSWRRDNDL
jgi:hypothetical protein